MNRTIRLTRLLVLFLVFGSVTTVNAQVATTPSAIDWSSTIYSIGIEWHIGGDTNTNATATVAYRLQGSSAWTSALPLVRVQLNGANTLAGSILFLSPDTTYEVRVTLSDADGGSEIRIITASTLRLPAPPSSGRSLHVVPGTGGGDGSAANPFRGVAAAQAASLPGDTLLLHGGSYGGRIQFTKSGTASAYIAWKAFGDGDALLDGVTVSGSHVWLEGITIRNQSHGLTTAGNPDDVVVSRCTFTNNHHAIFMTEGGRNWYVADNIIVGDTPYTTGSLDGEGVELNMTGGHTVAHNRISNVADGISYSAANVDIFGNDIFDVSDDGIEPDYGGANIRMWGNRIHNAAHHAISFQPQAGAPWYILRNQIVGNVEGALKFRTTDRFVLLHNTIVNWGTAWPGDAMMCCNEDHLLRAFARNNIWVSIQGGQIWGFDAGVADWRTDIDYDAFDWGSYHAPFAYGGVDLPDIPSLTAASGIEQHGIRVSKDDCFTSFNVPGPPPVPIPAQVMTLQPGCSAVDAGAVLPNVNEGRFAGQAPDIGAFEYGQAAPVFGPRPRTASDTLAAPSSLTASAVSSSRIDVAWTDNSTNETGFAIEQSAAGGSFAQVATVGANTTAFSATGLAASTTYAYRVRAFNGSAWSAYSPTASAITLPASGGGSTPYTGTPVALPGTIQAENFDNGGADVAYHDTTAGNSGGAYRTTSVDVDIETTTDAGGGYNVGYVSGGEWLKYTVNVATTGNYTIEVRVASPGTGGTFHIEANGVDKTGLLSVPATGAWQTWTTIRRTGVALAAGAQVLRVVMDTGASGGGAVGNFNWIRVTAETTGGSSTPYTGTPVALPGTIQAENFDNGGADVAYHDTTAGNSGGAYRATGVDVDIETTTDAGGGYNVGYVSGGEWLKYTVNVAATGNYTIEVRVASPGTGGTFHIEANGVDKTGLLSVPATGAWQTWTTIRRTGVALAAGAQVLRLVMDAGASGGGAVGNFNWIRVTAEATGGSSTPYTGTPVVLPGTIQAENFDSGGAQVAYHDTTAGNSGGAYRTTGVDVDIEATTDGGPGYNLGWVTAGEWLKYTVNVATAGNYTIEVRVASPGTGGSFHMEANGVDKTGALSVPATGGWQTWTTIRRTGVALAAGPQVLRVVMDAGSSGGGSVGNFNWIRCVAEATGGSSTPYTGTPVTLPGTIQAEDFDNGGAEVAYHDTTAGNGGGAYRPSGVDVDIQATADASGAFNVGWVSAGEWLKYTVSVAAAGTYTIEVRVASPGTGGNFHIEADGVNVTGPLSVPATGDWQTWTTLSRAGVTLAAGTQVLRVVMDAGPSGGGAVGNFNWIRVF